ncbi:MAG: DNA adenine methylase [Sulfurihydrogenibium sp.]|nr:DNA adenine methylase [Sulfurihydrogenibium sp.]
MICKTWRLKLKLKPFLKWVGGKRQLLDKIHNLMPEKINDYYEPFIGGGAVLFSLNKEEVNNITINDYNSELINTYKTIKERPIELIEALKKHKNTEDYFYHIRNLDRTSDFNLLTETERASRFIFLNKTCFNGLYRVNSKGFFNSPFGRYKNPVIFNEENIIQCSNFLSDVNIIQGDFELIKPFLNKESFVYFDPPYIPLSNTSNFTSYTNLKFDFEMQERLRDFCNYINTIGAKFLLSNSSSEIVTELYKNYDINYVDAKRSINSDISKRGKIKELLIKNY